MKEPLKTVFEHFLLQAENRHFSVDNEKFDQIYEQIWCDTEKSIKPFYFLGREYVAFAGGGGEFVQAHRVVDLYVYKGSLKPLGLVDFNHAVNNGKRYRGWLDGLLATSGNRKLVFCERCLFLKSENSNAQLQLF